MTGEQPPPENDLVGFLLSAPVRAWLAGVDRIESGLARTILHVPSCSCGDALDPRCVAQTPPAAPLSPDE